MVNVGVMGVQSSGLNPTQMYIRAGRSAITGVRRVNGALAPSNCALVSVLDVGVDEHPAMKHAQTSAVRKLRRLFVRTMSRCKGANLSSYPAGCFTYALRGVPILHGKT